MTVGNARASVEGDGASREVVWRAREGAEGWGGLYIGCNLRGRLGHWLTATDHMHVIILQTSTINLNHSYSAASERVGNLFWS